DDAEVEQTRDVVGQRAVVVGVAALEVNGDGNVRGGSDARDDPLGEVERGGLAVPVAVRGGDGPTARRDRLRAGLDDRLRAARVPRVIEHHGVALDVEFGEA